MLILARVARVGLQHPNGLPSGKRLQFAIENGPVELVDLPINNGWIFHSYVNVYQRVYTLFLCMKIAMHGLHRYTVHRILISETLISLWLFNIAMV